MKKLTILAMILALMVIGTTVLASPLNSPNFTDCTNLDLDSDGTLDATQCWNNGKDALQTWNQYWFVSIP